ncbi:hypothetical protein [Paraburkholderia hospita]|uniref:hypothetical protein n=1 Tax=Paraburkholderia hospita TaxID=169430 RepID=UPI000B345FCF|nr:hypothetical protein [Paraburkholderia hospita]OUL71615.1 hypothetical protein CA603_46785 [Paraburkholderia hospita]
MNERIVVMRLAEKLGVQTTAYVPLKRGGRRAKPRSIEEMRIEVVETCLGPGQTINRKGLDALYAYLGLLVDIHMGEKGPARQVAQLLYKRASQWFYQAKVRATNSAGYVRYKRLKALAECMADMQEAKKLMQECSAVLDLIEKSPATANRLALEALQGEAIEKRRNDKETNRDLLPESMKEFA